MPSLTKALAFLNFHDDAMPVIIKFQVATYQGFPMRYHSFIIPIASQDIWEKLYKYGIEYYDEGILMGPGATVIKRKCVAPI